ncbi:DUF2334 domain-containing protein [Undibacterium sp. Ren11W]|uniref:DUF2334 domain-containing protein n=1 Tax=Undibacterium sp. Ren11W TaxID=3413045 RepID=UPI003BF1DDB8
MMNNRQRRWKQLDLFFKYSFIFFGGFLFFILTPLATAATSARCESNAERLAILLKLDDVVADVSSSAGVSKKWSEVVEFLELNHIPASYGIVGESLERENVAYFSWLKKRVSKGGEFWNHGYRNRFTAYETGVISEFNGASAVDQEKALMKTQQLARQRLGIELKGFGPHASAVDTNTYIQLDKIPEIRYVWFYKPVDQRRHKAKLIQRILEIETPIFHPNFEVFSKNFDKRDRSLTYLALQAHPNEWDEQGFITFKKIIYWLNHEGATFCLPSDFFN